MHLCLDRLEPFGILCCCHWIVHRTWADDDQQPIILPIENAMDGSASLECCLGRCFGERQFIMQQCGRDHRFDPGDAQILGLQVVGLIGHESMNRLMQLWLLCFTTVLVK